MSFIESVLKCLGPLCFMGLQVSSASTALGILKTRSVGQLSCIPFASLLVNCVIWTLYGYLKDDYTILVPNFTGLLVSIFCLWAYIKHNTSKIDNILMVTAALIVFTGYLSMNSDFNSIGMLGCLLSIIVSGSPLAVMKTVITEKSTASMPFATSLVMWVNNLSWASYGYFIADDVMVYGPNALSLILSTTQLMLFCVYGFDSRGSKDDDEDKKNFEMRQSLLKTVASACDDV